MHSHNPKLTFINLLHISCMYAIGFARSTHVYDASRGPCVASFPVLHRAIVACSTYGVRILQATIARRSIRWRTGNEARNTASDDSCGGGLGTRLGHAPVQSSKFIVLPHCGMLTSDGGTQTNEHDTFAGSLAGEN